MTDEQEKNLALCLQWRLVSGVLIWAELGFVVLLWWSLLGEHPRWFVPAAALCFITSRTVKYALRRWDEALDELTRR